MGKFLFRLFTGIHAKLYKLTGGRFMGGGTDQGSVLVLTHKGAKTGKVRDTPLMSFRDGDNYLVVASAGGDARNPGWYHNVMTNPETEINVNGETIAVRARDAGSERDALWEKVVAAESRFESYETRTNRVIPIVILEPR
jgi:deazaflavin-dependent oxidoreductase (nitroreductase family)